MVLCSPKARNKFSEKKRKKKWLQIRRIIEVENWLLLCHLIGNLFGSLRWKISYNWKLNYLGPRWPQLLSSPSHPCDHKVDDLEVFMFLLIFSLFSCPEQLNRTHFQIVEDKNYIFRKFSDCQKFFSSDFDCDFWDIWSEWWGNMSHVMTWPIWKILTIFTIFTIIDNYDNYWQGHQYS